MPDILSVCKAEERGDAVDTPADDNAVDGKIGGTESAVNDRMEYQAAFVVLYQAWRQTIYFFAALFTPNPYLQYAFLQWQISL